MFYYQLQPPKCYHTFRFEFSVDLEAMLETVFDKNKTRDSVVIIWTVLGYSGT